jgi:hypothetical protein
MQASSRDSSQSLEFWEDGQPVRQYVLNKAVKYVLANVDSLGTWNLGLLIHNSIELPVKRAP